MENSTEGVVVTGMLSVTDTSVVFVRDDKIRYTYATKAQLITKTNGVMLILMTARTDENSWNKQSASITQKDRTLEGLVTDGRHKAKAFEIGPRLYIDVTGRLITQETLARREAAEIHFVGFDPPQQESVVPREIQDNLEVVQPYKPYVVMGARALKKKTVTKIKLMINDPSKIDCKLYGQFELGFVSLSSNLREGMTALRKDSEGEYYFYTKNCPDIREMLQVRMLY